MLSLADAKAYLASIPYVPAYWRGNGAFRPTMLVAHDMEAGESSTTAENCAGYMSRSPANGGPAKAASINFSCDNNSTVMSIVPGREAYHAAYGPINRCSVGTEHAGFANQSYDQWKDAYSYEMLWGQSAQLQAALCVVYDIPVQFLTSFDLKQGRWSGVTTHWEVTKAYVPGGHTDPGANFPMGEWLHAISDIIGSSSTSIPTPTLEADVPSAALIVNNLGHKSGQDVISEFRCQPNGHVAVRWQTGPNAGYGNWTGLAKSAGVEIDYPGAFNSLAVSKNQDERLELLVWHTAFMVYFRIVQNADGTWRNPEIA